MNHQVIGFSLIQNWVKVGHTWSVNHHVICFSLIQNWVKVSHTWSVNHKVICFSLIQNWVKISQCKSHFTSVTEFMILSLSYLLTTLLFVMTIQGDWWELANDHAFAKRSERVEEMGIILIRILAMLKRKGCGEHQSDLFAELISELWEGGKEKTQASKTVAPAGLLGTGLAQVC